MINATKVEKDTKLLVICGPTATGKTRLALYLAKIFEGEIISADSRQVYKQMDVGTGKDLPDNSKFTLLTSDLKRKNFGCYVVDGIKIWGYDIVSPKKEFSVSHYIKFARNIIKNITSRGSLPILVGGTGLYIKGVVDGIESATIPKNAKLRELLDGKNISELFEMLANLNPVKAASLNQSDKNNPRRLVRAIEIASQKLTGIKKKYRRKNVVKYDTLFIGLKAPGEIMEKAISVRVQKRVDMGIEKEINALMFSGVTWNMQSMNTLGYKEWIGFFAGKTEKEKVMEEWAKDEKKYVKRQMTWFKKNKRIKWFDVSKQGWEKNIEKLVKRWHNEVHAEKD